MKKYYINFKILYRCKGLITKANLPYSKVCLSVCVHMGTCVHIDECSVGINTE